ncbi:MAG: TIR domain-containing protein [bacterium]|nr:TIR domain-containing protein [bacterium]
MSSRVDTFISYSHKDSEYLEHLRRHLRPLEQHGRLNIWYDERIRAGQRWYDEVRGAIASAKVAILLVSDHFLGSDFIHEEELGPFLRSAEEEGLLILWIAVRPSLVDETPISQYQAVNKPEEPLCDFQRDELDRRLVAIAKSIQLAVEPLTKTIQFGKNLLLCRQARRTTQVFLDQLAEGSGHLEYSPGPGRWSIAEIAEHLLLTDRFFLKELRVVVDRVRAGKDPMLRRSLDYFPLSVRFVPKSIEPYVLFPFSYMTRVAPRPLRELMARNRVVEINAPAATIPRGLTPTSRLQAELEQSLKDIESFFQQHPHFDYREIGFEHPILGTPSIMDFLRFLAAHEQRHHKQMWSNLEYLRRSREHDTSTIDWGSLLGY